MNRKLETQIQKQITDFLHYKKIVHWRQNNAPVYDKSKQRYLPFKGMYGLSDIICLLDNEIVFVEVKSEKGTQSDNQIFFQSLVESLGHHYCVAKSWSDVDDYFKKNGLYIRVNDNAHNNLLKFKSGIK